MHRPIFRNRTDVDLCGTFVDLTRNEVFGMERLRTSRVAEQMKKELGEIVNHKLKDPRIGFVTITDVELTNDLLQATVYISVLGDEAEKNRTLEGLQKATGFIRSEIGKRIRLRKEIGRASCRERGRYGWAADR